MLRPVRRLRVGPGGASTTDKRLATGFDEIGEVVRVRGPLGGYPADCSTAVAAGYPSAARLSGARELRYRVRVMARRARCAVARTGRWWCRAWLRSRRPVRVTCSAVRVLWVGVIE